MRRGFLFPAVICCAACAISKPDIIQVGPWFPARPAEEVVVFASREETRRPWGAIAIIHSERIPTKNKAELDRQKRLARKMAARAGADGIIISEESVGDEPYLNGSGVQESYISALAFKYATDISTAAR